MSTPRGHDELYLTVQRLVRLAREGKIYTTEAARTEVAKLLHDAANAVELAGGIVHQRPIPRIIPTPESDTIVAKPYDRRKEL